MQMRLRSIHARNLLQTVNALPGRRVFQFMGCIMPYSQWLNALERRQRILMLNGQILTMEYEWLN